MNTLLIVAIYITGCFMGWYYHRSKHIDKLKQIEESYKETMKIADETIMNIKGCMDKIKKECADEVIKAMKDEEK